MLRQTLAREMLASLAGMLVLVLWGLVFWGFLADPLGVFHKIPNDTVVTQTLLAGSVPTGTYFMPWPRNTPAAFEQFVAQHRSGPFFRLSYVREGVDPNSPAKLALGCLHYLLVAALAVALVRISGSTSYVRRFSLVLLAGLIGSVFITAGDPIWFHMPWDYARAVLLYEVVSWILLGSVVAKLAPPPNTRPSSAESPPQIKIQ
jgi:hypothetical protein